MQRLRTNAHGFAGLVTEHVDSTAQLEEAAQHTQRRVAELEGELESLASALSASQAEVERLAPAARDAHAQYRRVDSEHREAAIALEASDRAADELRQELRAAVGRAELGEARVAQHERAAAQLRAELDAEQAGSAGLLRQASAAAAKERELSRHLEMASTGRSAVSDPT